MILSNPSKYKFISPEKLFFEDDPTIVIKNMWGKTLYTIIKTSSGLLMYSPLKDKQYSFDGVFDYIKIFRKEDPLFEGFKVQVFCANCGDRVYNFSVKLPLLFIIETDFDVTKDKS